MTSPISAALLADDPNANMTPSFQAGQLNICHGRRSVSRALLWVGAAMADPAVPVALIPIAAIPSAAPRVRSSFRVI